ncbi:MAG: hypothetical protein Q9165_000643 [Trypethelium subeluteriae]
MSVETDLGWFQLSHQKAVLQLMLTATAKASGPLPVQVNASLDQSEAIRVDDRSPWVSRGNNFCIVLDVSASDQDLKTTLLTQDFLPSFGELLSKSEKNAPRKKLRAEPQPHSRAIDAVSTNRDLFRDQNSYLQNDDLLDETANQQDLPLRDTSFSTDSLSLGLEQTEDFEMLDDLPAALQAISPHTHVGGTGTNQGMYQTELAQHPSILLSDGLPSTMTDISMRLISAIDLIDAAFRMTISKKPTKLARSIKSTVIKALAERTVFIPTISRALTTRISTNAVSPSLRAKLAHLGVCDPGDALGPELRGAASVDHDEAATDRARHNAAVKTRLWRMAQGTLRNPAAARRLRPIRNPELQIGSSSVGKDGILDFVVTPCWKRESEMLDDDDEDEMLTGEEDDDILEGWEESRDDILKDIPFAPSLGERRNPRREWELPVSKFDPGSMDEDILFPPLHLPSSKPDLSRLELEGVRDGIYEEMLA